MKRLRRNVRPYLVHAAALLGIMLGNRRIRYARHVPDSSTEIWQMALQLELEGIVARMRARFTVPGARRAG